MKLREQTLSTRPHIRLLPLFNLSSLRGSRLLILGSVLYNVLSNINSRVSLLSPLHRRLFSVPGSRPRPCTSILSILDRRRSHSSPSLSPQMIRPEMICKWLLLLHLPKQALHRLGLLLSQELAPNLDHILL